MDEQEEVLVCYSVCGEQRIGLRLLQLQPSGPCSLWLRCKYMCSLHSNKMGQSFGRENNVLSQDNENILKSGQKISIFVVF